MTRAKERTASRKYKKSENDFFHIDFRIAIIMQRKQKIFEILRIPKVMAFVKEHKHADIRALALQFGTKVSFPLSPVLEWIDCLQRAAKKLPEHAEQECFFTRRAIEQASSESTAMYKASQLSGSRLLNISGGLGIDDWAFAKKGFHSDSCDPDEELNELVRANQDRMGANGINRIDAKAEDFLATENLEHYDWVYADPDRREDGKRLVGMDDCVPQILDLWERIQSVSNYQLVKLSPLYPLEQLEKELAGLERIEVVALHGEVKEVLAFAKSGTKAEQILRCATELSGAQSYKGMPEFGTTEPLEDSLYFYEVNAAISKANLGVCYSKELGTKCLISNGIYQASDKPLPDFFGRGFEIVSSGVYGRKQFQGYLKIHGIKKANMASRYFKLSPDELKKIHKLGDGGDTYFFFFTDRDGGMYFIHGKKIGRQSLNLIQDEKANPTI